MSHVTNTSSHSKILVNIYIESRCQLMFSESAFQRKSGTNAMFRWENER